MRHPRPHFNPAPLSLAVALALTVSGFAHAQTADSGKTVTLAIAAQSLGSALNELSTATGTPIAFSPALVAGKTVPAIKGTLTLRQALSQLLAGSGLAATDDGSSIVIRNASAIPDRESTLPAIKVTAQSVGDGTSEGSGSYTSRTSTTATKLNLSPRETPQTLTIVTRQKMNDLGLTTVEDTLKSTSSVFVQYKGSDGVTLYSRGFGLQSQYDGLPNPIGLGENSASPQPDTAFLDRIEILQGASGLLAGAGEPGGTINLVRKRPTEIFQAHIETEIGSWDKRRVVGDISGPLLESGKIRGRLVALSESSNSFKDYFWQRKTGVYGALDADVGSNTKVGITYLHQENSGNDDYGLPTAIDGSFLNLPRSAFYGGGHDRQRGEWDSTGVNIEHKLAAEWVMKASYNHTRSFRDVASSYLYGELNAQSGEGLVLSQQLFQNESKSDSADIYISGPFSALGRKHELVFGANGYHYDTNARGLYNFDTPIGNIYSFNPASIPRPTGEMPQWEGNYKTQQHGAYGAVRAQLTDSLKAIVGSRISWYKYSNPQNIALQKEDGVISPYAGLIYDLNKSISIYASYSDIFKPQSRLNAQGSTISPVLGKNLEFGVKGEFLDKRLSAAASIFRLEQSNLAIVDSTVPYDPGNACKGYCYLAGDKVLSQGLDLRLDGQISSGWNASMGYTFVDSKYNSGKNNGKNYLYSTGAPQNVLYANTAYKLPGTTWVVGGNIKAQSKITYSDEYIGPFKTQQGGIVLLGLMARYKFDHNSSLTLLANNILDRKYYASVFYPIYNNSYGSPRNFSVNYRYDF